MTDDLDAWERRLSRLVLAEARRLVIARAAAPTTNPPTDPTATKENQ